jgi:hypothetical protein
VTGAVCGVARSSNRRFSVISGVSTKASLVDFAIWGSVEWKTHVF